MDFNCKHKFGAAPEAWLQGLFLGHPVDARNQAMNRNI